MAIIQCKLSKNKKPSCAITRQPKAIKYFLVSFLFFVLQHMSLPTEILIDIFSQLDQKCISQCKYVCKDWNQPAFSVFYRKLSLDSTNIYLASQHLNKNAVDRRNYFKYCVGLKELTITGSRAGEPPTIFAEQTLTRKQFLTLLEYMPNIRMLSLEKAFGTNLYMQYILDINSLQLLRNIQAISPSQTESLCRETKIDHYFAVSYKYRTTLTHLKFDFWERGRLTGFHNDNALVSLSHFTALTSLCIHNYVDPQLSMYDIHEACPNLITLELHICERTCNPTPEKTDQRILNLALKSLTITAPTISEKFIRYIVDHSPSQLQTIHLTIDMNMHEWIDDVGMTNALDLANRLSIVDNATMIFPRLHQSSYETSGIGNFFKLLKAFRGNRKSICNVTYLSFTDNMLSHSSFTYQLGFYDIYRDTSQEQTILDIALPLNNYSVVVGPEMIDDLSIELRHEDTRLFKAFLVAVLCHYPNLQKYNFANNYWERHIQLCTSLDPKTTPFDSFKTPGSINERFTAVICKLDPPSFKEIKHIASILPNIERYVLSGYEFRLNNRHDNYFDILPFEKLKRFYVNIKNLYSHFYIHYIDTNEAYSFHLENKCKSSDLIPSISVDREHAGKNAGEWTTTINCSKRTTIIFFVNTGLVVGEIENGRLNDYISMNNDYDNREFMLTED